VASLPQTSVSRPLGPQQSSLEQPPEPSRLPEFLTLAGIGAAIAAIGAFFSTRWRGILLAHIFFLTLWLAIQVFLFAISAYWCLPGDSPKWIEWLWSYIPRISQCAPAGVSTGSSTITSGSSPTSPGSSTATPPGSSTSPGSSTTTPPGSSTSPGSSAGTPPGSSTPPGTSTATPRSSPAWAPKASTTCWRDRSLNGNECFGPAKPHRRSPPHRLRPPAPPPCPRFYSCGWGDI